MAWFAEDDDKQRLEEAVLGTIRALDQPRSPAGECERAFTNALYGRDDAFRERFRARVLAADHAALRAVAARYLAPGSGRVAVVCSSASEGDFAAADLTFGKL